jgi:hypothetical protein
MKTLLITNEIDSSQKSISCKLQQAWNKTIQKDSRKNSLNFITENDDFKIISKKEQFETFNNQSFIPNLIFIVPELMWENDDVNEGYYIARELITHIYKSNYIQVIFLSVLDRKSLFKIVDIQNKGFVESFPHICLLDNNVQIKFDYYSSVHYKLIKHLGISDDGRLQKVGHEMNSVKANIQKSNIIDEKNKVDLLSQLEELSLFQAWTNKNIPEIIKQVKDTDDNNVLVLMVQAIDSILEEIDLKFTKTAEGRNEPTLKIKSNYKVFIIEDNIEHRSDLYNIFSNFYQEVYPDKNNKYLVDGKIKDFSITEAKDLIRLHGKNYQIFLLDLLYKDEQDHWLNFNGLDLYQLIRKVNPYAAIRIVTSLPRGIVSKVVEVILRDSEKPNTDQIFTKKYGFEALKDSIIESIDSINKECLEKEKSKTVLAPFPKTGIFDWTGIPELMHALMHDRKDEYSRHRAITESIFNKYLKGMLDKTTSNWNKGELPKPAMKSKITDSYFLGKLSGIMTHRLIAINKALKDEDFKVRYEDYIDIIKNISNISQINKGYFQTKLGFNGSENKEQAKENASFQIATKNLFPEELNYITSLLSEREKESSTKLLKSINSELNEFFKKILCELVTYENWEELGLEYDPYQNQKKSIDAGAKISQLSFPDFTFKQLQDFLQSLIDNYHKNFVEPIATFVTDNAIGSNKIKNKSIEILINNLYNQ